MGKLLKKLWLAITYGEPWKVGLISVAVLIGFFLWLIFGSGSTNIVIGPNAGTLSGDITNPSTPPTERVSSNLHSETTIQNATNDAKLLMDNGHTEEAIVVLKGAQFSQNDTAAGKMLTDILEYQRIESKLLQLTDTMREEENFVWLHANHDEMEIAINRRLGFWGIERITKSLQTVKDTLEEIRVIAIPFFRNPYVKESVRIAIGCVLRHFPDDAQAIKIMNVFQIEKPQASGLVEQSEKDANNSILFGDKYLNSIDEKVRELQSRDNGTMDQKLEYELKEAMFEQYIVSRVNTLRRKYQKAGMNTSNLQQGLVPLRPGFFPFTPNTTKNDP